MPRTLVVGDVHGCARELGRLLDEVDPDRVILVGDLFTRGPDPAAVWRLVRQWEAEAVLGNHDLRVIDRWKPGKQLPRRALRWLAERPSRIDGAGWTVVHAGVGPDRDPRRSPDEVAVGLRGRRDWWRTWRGDRTVIFGHVARATPIDRWPHVIGLDTGCVRGGKLTGWLVEKRRFVSVPATRDYTA